MGAKINVLFSCPTIVVAIVAAHQSRSLRRSLM